MRMDYKLSRIIVLGIAVVYILLGIAQAKFGFEIDKNVSNGLMIAAAVIFFIGRKPNNPVSNADEEAADATNAEPTERLEEAKEVENQQKTEVNEENKEVKE